MTLVLSALVLWAATLLPAAVQPQTPAWPDTSDARLEVQALVQKLNDALLASRSATLTLEEWCRTQQLAADPSIIAYVVKGADKVPTVEQRRRLGVTEGESVKYRQVQLRCGNRLLSEADNWYVPSRLTPEMNQQLETTDMPFGRVVGPLEPYRLTFEVTLRWPPLPDSWQLVSQPASRGSLFIPDALFEHRAILYTKDHQPFSEVFEVYQRQILPDRSRP